MPPTTTHPPRHTILLASPSHLIILEPTWPDVDRTRSLIAAAGLDPHISVHHHSAARWFQSPSRPSTFAHSLKRAG